jgi:hypothetical protein
MAESTDKEGIIGGVFFVFLTGVLVVLFCMLFHAKGEDGGKKELKLEAVKLGHAEWKADKNGNVHFEWKKVGTEKVEVQENGK